MRNFWTRSNEKQGIMTSLASRFNEYCTKQICPRCLQLGKEVFTEYLKHLPSNPSPEAELYAVNRIKTCPECRTYFHRDGMAAQNTALMMESLLVAGGEAHVLHTAFSQKGSTKQLWFEQEEQREEEGVR
ncbi:hypothetical protein BCR43DRAFT_482081 [Syncephalastrum racemosum]|uniref:Cas12f1-like TNB domain-containing protein n=1 Tax=Syncephalastrum racemosum TaxID=13706 RepID=A0A1X2HT11_SYNRA|nr:hypothetical protein BCR43DRAFT_482081 [Syncephalastrum racemosum]